MSRYKHWHLLHESPQITAELFIPSAEHQYSKTSDRVCEVLIHMATFNSCLDTVATVVFSYNGYRNFNIQAPELVDQYTVLCDVIGDLFDPDEVYDELKEVARLPNGYGWEAYITYVDPEATPELGYRRCPWRRPVLPLELDRAVHPVHNRLFDDDEIEAILDISDLQDWVDQQCQWYKDKVWTDEQDYETRYCPISKKFEGKNLTGKPVFKKFNLEAYKPYGFDNKRFDKKFKLHPHLCKAK